METTVPQYKIIKFTTNTGEKIVAKHHGDEILVKGNVNGKRLMSRVDFLEFVKSSTKPLERTPDKDDFVRSAKAKRDKEIMRILLYSNPLINPFGTLPSKEGITPIIKNPLIEGLLNSLYGEQIIKN